MLTKRVLDWRFAMEFNDVVNMHNMLRCGCAVYCFNRCMANYSFRWNLFIELKNVFVHFDEH